MSWSRASAPSSSLTLSLLLSPNPILHPFLPTPLPHHCLPSAPLPRLHPPFYLCPASPLPHSVLLRPPPRPGRSQAQAAGRRPGVRPGWASAWRLGRRGEQQLFAISWGPRRPRPYPVRGGVLLAPVFEAGRGAGRPQRRPGWSGRGALGRPRRTFRPARDPPPLP